jgi:hypothetical protein
MIVFDGTPFFVIERSTGKRSRTASIGSNGRRNATMFGEKRVHKRKEERRKARTTRRVQGDYLHT